MSSQAGNVVTERGAKVERNGSKPEIGRIVFFLSTSSPRQNDIYRSRYVSLPSLETFLRESTNSLKDRASTYRQKVVEGGMGTYLHPQLDLDTPIAQQYSSNPWAA